MWKWSSFRQSLRRQNKIMGGDKMSARRHFRLTFESESFSQTCKCLRFLYITTLTSLRTMNVFERDGECRRMSADNAGVVGGQKSPGAGSVEPALPRKVVWIAGGALALR